MRLRHRAYFLLLLAVTFLESCSSSTTAQSLPIGNASLIALTTPTGTTDLQPVVAPPRPTQTAIPSPVKPIVTSIVALPPENILKYQPFEIAPGLLPDVKPTGVLLVWGEQPQLLHFDPPVRLETFPDINTHCLAISPGGKWLAYCTLSDVSPTGEWLIVESADRQQYYRFAMDTHLIWFGSHEWLDDQRLIFPLLREMAAVYPMVVINPFTGEQTELASDYPDISGTYAGPVGRMAFGYSSLVYDPSLNLVIFPRRQGPRKSIVLWERQSNTTLAEVEDRGEFLNYPLWSPDAQQFAVAVVHQVSKYYNTEEWFLVSRQGDVQQLTHFGDYFMQAEIGDGNWSPDGRKLAFWVQTNPSSCPNAHLAVLEIATERVTDTCIPGTLEFAPPPIWSLDSRYLAVVNYTASPYQTILVDFEHGRAFDITEYGIPIGWLALP